MVKNPPVTPIYATQPKDSQLKKLRLEGSGFLKAVSLEDPTDAFGTNFSSDILYHLIIRFF